MPQAGLFYNFGNKLTAESGFIYQAGVDAKFGKKSDNKLKEGQADLDLGWRAALDARNFVDVLVGGGYNWTRYEPESGDYDMQLTSKSPFAKAALGYNHPYASLAASSTIPCASKQAPAIPSMAAPSSRSTALAATPWTSRTAPTPTPKSAC